MRRDPSHGAPQVPATVRALMPRFLIELPADEPERARRFWQELLQTTLESRRPEEGRGWQAPRQGG